TNLRQRKTTNRVGCRERFLCYHAVATSCRGCGQFYAALRNSSLDPDKADRSRRARYAERSRNLRWLHAPATISNCDPPSPPEGFLRSSEIARMPARSPRTSTRSSPLSVSGVSTISSTSDLSTSVASIHLASESS